MPKQIIRRQSRGKTPKPRLNLGMSPELHALVHKTARERGVSVSAWVSNLIARELGVPGHELPPKE
ncbi:toxin-antitoxin system HicB family antitoxin [Kocuria carniphila]|uniref:toxin-antitoxin system HicB family antitoxin n=1 Tax=Kocuria carniphila TaxID=262208 RepID=UPI0034DB63A7